MQPMQRQAVKLLRNRCNKGVFMVFPILVVFMLGLTTGAVIDNTNDDVHQAVSEFVEPNE